VVTLLVASPRGTDAHMGASAGVAVAWRGTRHPYSCWINTVNELSSVRAGVSLVTMVFVTV
jgi:hypothetical protein